MTAVYEQFWIKTGSKTPAETCFCQGGLNRFEPGLNLGFNRCWQKLANPAALAKLALHALPRAVKSVSEGRMTSV